MQITSKSDEFTSNKNNEIKNQINKKSDSPERYLIASADPDSI